MKKICLAVILQLALNMLFAQNNEPVGIQRTAPVVPMRDMQEYQGYVIRLIPAMPVPESKGSYGFDILKDNKPVVHQFQNPLPFSRKGIQKKEDAYKIAQWMIREFNSTGQWQKSVPSRTAMELKIETN